MKLSVAVILLVCLVIVAKATPSSGPVLYHGPDDGYDYGYDNDNYDGGYYYDDYDYNDRYYGRYRYPYRRSGLGLGAGLGLGIGSQYY
ncbi:unnamed protein product [Danaus chrysippus]|uniref:(African queen) hypothetical protein n=1 Tax=Danaus chrysippus TaxID=151541 RepID=A0A8J2WAH1_9NEOP|nr:unnamed protein product [Danaus chrysippus]